MDFSELTGIYQKDLGALEARTRMSAKPDQDKKKTPLYKACVEFESIFIKQMLNAMRKTIDKSGSLLQRSMTEDIFEDMLYDEYSKSMAEMGTFKLAETMYNQLSKYSG
ncbi:MAG: rod-binding protein [Spirochaetales bacterium]|nr:rod-binding protein [Spirochaetales bacterium]